MRSARSRKAPSIDPTTIPAIAPPESPVVRPLLVVAAPDEADPVDEEVELEVAVIEEKGGSEDVAAMGNTTPEQMPVVFEKTQQESVAFGELAEQYEQRPLRLEE